MRILSGNALSPAIFFRMLSISHDGTYEYRMKKTHSFMFEQL